MAKYKEWKTLATSGAVTQYPDEPVDGILMVAESPVLHWKANYSSYGHDECYLFPVVYKGGRCFVVRECWSAAPGYCAEGTNEHIIGLKDGVKILIEQGALDALFKKEGE